MKDKRQFILDCLDINHTENTENTENQRHTTKSVNNFKGINVFLILENVEIQMPIHWSENETI